MKIVVVKPVELKSEGQTPNLKGITLYLQWYNCQNHCLSTVQSLLEEKFMSDSSARGYRQANTLNKAEEQPITAAEMLKQLIASGYIVLPSTGYVQPTIPSAYRVVPSITSVHSIATPMRPQANWCPTGLLLKKRSRQQSKTETIRRLKPYAVDIPLGYTWQGVISFVPWTAYGG